MVDDVDRTFWWDSLLSSVAKLDFEGARRTVVKIRTTQPDFASTETRDRWCEAAIRWVACESCFYSLTFQGADPSSVSLEAMMMLNSVKSPGKKKNASTSSGSVSSWNANAGSSRSASAGPSSSSSSMTIPFEGDLFSQISMVQFMFLEDDARTDSWMKPWIQSRLECMTIVKTLATAAHGPEVLCRLCAHMKESSAGTVPSGYGAISEQIQFEMTALRHLLEWRLHLSKLRFRESAIALHHCTTLLSKPPPHTLSAFASTRYCYWIQTFYDLLRTRAAFYFSQVTALRSSFDRVPSSWCDWLVKESRAEFIGVVKNNEDLSLFPWGYHLPESAVLPAHAMSSSSSSARSSPLLEGPGEFFEDPCSHISRLVWKYPAILRFPDATGVRSTLSGSPANRASSAGGLVTPLSTIPATGTAGSALDPSNMFALSSLERLGRAFAPSFGFSLNISSEGTQGLAVHENWWAMIRTMHLGLQEHWPGILTALVDTQVRGRQNKHAILADSPLVAKASAPQMRPATVFEPEPSVRTSTANAARRSTTTKPPPDRTASAGPDHAMSQDKDVRTLFSEASSSSANCVLLTAERVGDMVYFCGMIDEDGIFLVGGINSANFKSKAIASIQQGADMLNSLLSLHRLERLVDGSVSALPPTPGPPSSSGLPSAGGPNTGASGSAPFSTASASGSAQWTTSASLVPTWTSANFNLTSY